MVATNCEQYVLQRLADIERENNELRDVVDSLNNTITEKNTEIDFCMDAYNKIVDFIIRRFHYTPCYQNVVDDKEYDSIICFTIYSFLDDDVRDYDLIKSIIGDPVKGDSNE